MQPLSGFRIIDMTDERGALCGRVLADLGADVIYVELPSGSPFRQAPPLALDKRTSLAFAFRNAGKRGVSLDISTSGGRDELHRLVDTADAWIESNPTGFLAAQGLAPEEVLRAHPTLVITSITDFGQIGPHRNYLGTDMIGYAMGGMLYRAGAAHRPPVVAPGSQAYDTASITAAFGTAMAIYHRLHTGRGQWLDVSVQEATSNLADWS
ncbi:MAG TPA: CoA transferase, partial [Candidatus Binatia bacterium]